MQQEHTFSILGLDTGENEGAGSLETAVKVHEAQNNSLKKKSYLSQKFTEKSAPPPHV